MKSFLVSVIIPVYNREKYISEAVESCVHLPQVGEILIVDDGSTDNSFQVIADLERNYSKIKVLIHPNHKNFGRSASRNLAIKNAKYDYISFLDSDDWYTDQMFKNEEKIFLENPDVEGVYGITSSKFENDNAKNKFFKRFESDISKVNDDVSPNILYKTFILGGLGQFTTDAITLKKTVFTKSGLFPLQLNVCEDTHLWARISSTSKLVSNQNLNPIAIRRVHDDNSIINSDNILNYSFLEMNRSLFLWSLKQNFNYDKKNDFFIGYSKHIKNFSEFRKLLKVAFNNPSIFFNSFFYRKVIQLIKS